MADEKVTKINLKPGETCPHCDQTKPNPAAEPLDKVTFNTASKVGGKSYDALETADLPRSLATECINSSIAIKASPASENGKAIKCHFDQDVTTTRRKYEKDEVDYLPRSEAHNVIASKFAHEADPDEEIGKPAPPEKQNRRPGRKLQDRTVGVDRKENR